VWEEKVAQLRREGGEELRREEGEKASHGAGSCGCWERSFAWTGEKRKKEEEDKVSVGPTRNVRRILTVAPVTRPGAALHAEVVWRTR
jgi:hypothetical protein